MKTSNNGQNAAESLPADTVAEKCRHCGLPIRMVYPNNPDEGYVHIGAGDICDFQWCINGKTYAEPEIVSLPAPQERDSDYDVLIAAYPDARIWEHAPDDWQVAAGSAGEIKTYGHKTANDAISTAAKRIRAMQPKVAPLPPVEPKPTPSTPAELQKAIDRETVTADALAKAIRACVPQPDSSSISTEQTFEDVLKKRAGEYQDMGRNHRIKEEYEAACCCEDKASGLYVAVKLYRAWNAAKASEPKKEMEG